MKAWRGFALPALVLVVPFVAARLPYFWGHALPGIKGDTAGYFEPIEQALNGEWPTFGLRTPGYPVFLSVVMSLSRNAVWFVTAQVLLSIASQLWLLAGVYALRPSLAVGAAVAIAIARASMGSFDEDTILMADSVYSSCLLLATGFVVRLFGDRPGVRDFAGASLSMAVAIITRPAAMFLVATWFMLLALVGRRRASRRQLLALLIPFPAALLSLCLYNRATIGVFSVSPWGVASVLGATACYWQTNDAYPRELNWVIGDMQSRLTAAERRTLDESWDLTAVGHVYATHFDDVHNVGVLDEYEDEGHRRLLRKIAIEAIKSRPDLYAKFVGSQFWAFMGALSGNGWGSYESLMANRACMLLNANTRRHFLTKHLAVRLPDVRGLRDVVVQQGDGGWVRPSAIRVRRPVTARLLAAIDGAFRGGPWIVMWLVVLLASAWKVIQSGCGDPGASAVLVVATLHLGAGVLISLVNLGAGRFSTATEFSVYLSLALAPLLLSPRGGAEGSALP